MPAAIIARTDVAFTIQLEIPYGSSMLDFEEVIQKRLDEAGVLATQGALQRFDADGSPIQVGDTKLTSKGRLKKEYQTRMARGLALRCCQQGFARLTTGSHQESPGLRPPLVGPGLDPAESVPDLVTRDRPEHLSH